MSLFSMRGLGDTQSELIPARNSSGFRGKRVSTEEAMRHSGVWACLRLRADIVSSLPVDLFRATGGVRIPIRTLPVFLTKPGALHVGGVRSSIDEWLYASQIDLDRYGNCFGLIMERDALMRISRVDLVEAGSVTVRVKGGVVTYIIGGKAYGETEVWHERQYVVAGLPVGLSPIAYAAYSIGQYTSAQEFALAWFSGTNRPAGTLRNIKKTLLPEAAANAKAKFRDSTQAGDVLVLGADWEYKVESVPEATAQFLNAQGASIGDVCRFLGVPGDMIDAPISGSAVTYANISQRNLQLLTMNMGPVIQRRERALTAVTPSPQFVKLNTGGLLRLDPLGQAQLIGQRTKDRNLAPDESRALYDSEPLTDEQIADFARLFGDPNKTPVPPAGGAPS